MNDDIMRMAQEAGLVPGWVVLCKKDEDALVRFAALIRAAERDKFEQRFLRLEALMQIREQQPNKPCCLTEREACAKLCEEWANGLSGEPEMKELAAAIRARGQA